MDSNNPAPAGNQKQLTPKRKILIYGSIFLVTFVIVFAIGSFLLRKPANNEKLEVSGITMTVSYNEYLGYSVKIAGVAKNTSGRALSYASVEFSVFDSSGNNLGTALDNISNLGDGDTWRFEATLFSFPKVKPTAWKLADINAW